MPDSREVIFSSQRTTNRLMYRQGLEQGSSAQLITSGANTNYYLARLSPDRASILLEGAPVGSHKMGLYRVDLSGGVPQRLFDTQGFVMFWCTNRADNFCVFGQPSTGKNELVVVAFDPVEGPGKELVRIPLEVGTSADIGFDYSWQLSPDGSRIGIVKRHSNQIRLVPLRGGPTRVITLKDFPTHVLPATVRIRNSNAIIYQRRKCFISAVVFFLPFPISQVGSNSSKLRWGHDSMSRA